MKTAAILKQIAKSTVKSESLLSKFEVDNVEKIIVGGV